MELSNELKLTIIQYQLHQLGEEARLGETQRADLLRHFRETETALRAGTLTHQDWEIHLLRWHAYQAVVTGEIDRAKRENPPPDAP